MKTETLEWIVTIVVLIAIATVMTGVVYFFYIRFLSEVIF